MNGLFGNKILRTKVFCRAGDWIGGLGPPGRYWARS